MSTTVSYKGATIATVNNNTKTLQTQGKYLEADVILTDVSQSSPTISSLTVTPTTSQQTFNSGSVDGYKPVVVNAMPAGTAGTPTATKGTVSNHSVSVTPRVTNATGYITGSTKTGTAVTVTASELVSGSETKTANGTYDVTNLAELVVNVAAGPTNMVTGTFTPQTAGAVESVSVPYAGSGHPVMCAIFPADGSYKSTTDVYNLIQQYAVVEWFMSKANTALAPTYTTSGGANYGCTAWVYKSSATSATTYSRSSAMTTNTYSSAAPTAAGATCVRFSDDTTLKYFVASTSYGLVQDVEYRYVILYSS